ncbi:carbonyl reductase 1 [Caerostris darwini]|uniref:carbonyl reductase (NADPH) n=1 Tax=Caerostris darwini TaxID=1538125 RepID=A0AAV4UML1_9ARAC|nr:carbonyl reductase 1 [Caerostris darwini]
MMSKRVAVVTGSNKGIGYEIVRELCSKFDGDVFLTARNEDRGRAAVERLKSEGSHPKFHQLDIMDDASIKSLAVFLEQNYGGLDVLVNNAAILYRLGDTTPFAEQAVNTIKVNFSGTLKVCLHLFPLLRSHARVVHMSSSAGYLSYIESEDVRNRFRSENLTKEELCGFMKEFVKHGQEGTHEAKGWGCRPYSISKIGINALTIIQQKKFLEDERADIVVNAVHPGFVITDMTGGKGELTPSQGTHPPFFDAFFGVAYTQHPTKLLTIPHLGAEAPVYLALLPPNVESPRGKFVWNDKTVASWTA